jgi:hypothetical protein
MARDPLVMALRASHISVGEAEALEALEVAGESWLLARVAGACEVEHRDFEAALTAFRRAERHARKAAKRARADSR